MTIIQQPTLFDLDILSQLDIQERHAEIFSPIDFTKLVMIFQKDNTVGAPITLNYEATIRSMMARFLEGIPTIKALVRRLNEDLAFKLSLGFLYSDRIPSEATFSRVMSQLSKHIVLIRELSTVLLDTIHAEYRIYQEDVSIDATAIEAHTKPVKTEKVILPSTENQRHLSLEEIESDLKNHPSWGVKKNSKGKNNYWFGYKGHFAVSTTNQYLLSVRFITASIADMSLAIPLLRDVQQLGVKNVHVLMDKGYDAQAIYQEAHSLGLEPIIDLKKIAENDGVEDKFCAPTCLIEEPYKYDSFDKRYGALKYRRPEARCRDCPLQREDLCQKVIKIKQSTNYRKYAHPARGTNAWKKLYNQRSSVERVNAYLKESFGLNQTRYIQGQKVETEILLKQIAYNACLFAKQNLIQRKIEKEIVVSF